MPRFKPNHIDYRIGKRLRQRRNALGISMAALGLIIGVEHQQIQKYEAAKNRISAAQLYELANAMEVPIGWFFDDIK